LEIISEQKFRPIFIFIDTDKHASPFDILMTIDVVPDVVVLKYENVTPEDVEKIMYDALFPRGPKGVRFTKFFVNEKDLEGSLTSTISAPPYSITQLRDTFYGSQQFNHSFTP
jgi:hypothetical protein